MGFVAVLVVWLPVPDPGVHVSNIFITESYNPSI